MATETTTTLLTDIDERTIRDVVSRAQEAQNDTAVLMALHNPEVVIVNLAGRRVLGREAFETAMTSALASPLRKVHTRLEVLDVRLATPDVAIVSCTKEVDDGRDDPDKSSTLPATGALTYVMTRTRDSWRIALAQTTPTLPAPPAEKLRPDQG